MRFHVFALVICSAAGGYMFGRGQRLYEQAEFRTLHISVVAAEAQVAQSIQLLRASREKLIACTLALSAEESAGAKGDEIEYLRKAAWYLQRLIEQKKAKRDGRKPCRPNEMPKVPV